MLVSVGWFQIMTNENWFFDQTSIKDCLFQCNITTWFLGTSSRSNLKKIQRSLSYPCHFMWKAKKNHTKRHETPNNKTQWWLRRQPIWIFPIWSPMGFRGRWVVDAISKMPESNELTSQSSTPRVTCITPGALSGSFFLKWGGGWDLLIGD